MSDEVRVCRVCGEEKNLEKCFPKKIEGEKIYYQRKCYTCIRKKTNKEWWRAYRRTKKFKEWIKEYSKEWREKNPTVMKGIKNRTKEKRKEAIKEHERKKTKDLKDHYIKRVLYKRGIQNREVTPEMMKIQRTLIQIHRYVRKKKSEETQNTEEDS